jgi:hypothetical protein
VSIEKRIRELTDIPDRFIAMLEAGLRVVKNLKMQAELCDVASLVAGSTWKLWQAWRGPVDNRQEHEWVVFANAMRIAESEGLTLSERRVATAFAFTHDSYPIRRIMEADIECLKSEARTCRKTDPKRAKRLLQQAAALELEKKGQRNEHMKGGADNAEWHLSKLKRPSGSDCLFSPIEVHRCVRIVRNHDKWKTGKRHPLGKGRLAMVCLDADVLWPLHPIGVLADVERSNEDFNQPAMWKTKLKDSLNTLSKYGAYWGKTSFQTFKCGKLSFLTKEGCVLFREWRRLWRI